MCDRSNVKYELQLQLQRLQVLHRTHDDDNNDDDDDDDDFHLRGHPENGACRLLSLLTRRGPSWLHRGKAKVTDLHGEAVETHLLDIDIDKTS